MSYSVSFVEKNRELAWFNHTSNCAMMLRMAIGQDGIRTLRGLRCKDVLSQLERAYRHITDPDNRRYYEPHNPQNGWGSHESAIRFLGDILLACRRYPDAKIEVSA